MTLEFNQFGIFCTTFHCTFYMSNCRIFIQSLTKEILRHFSKLYHVLLPPFIHSLLFFRLSYSQKKLCRDAIFHQWRPNKRHCVCLQKFLFFRSFPSVDWCYVSMGNELNSVFLYYISSSFFASLRFHTILMNRLWYIALFTSLFDHPIPVHLNQIYFIVVVIWFTYAFLSK